ncbi:MAG: hypothetical protein LBP87_05095, partial [Planctomycetaceae bacterium]|jgi:hypothetical protein|nr:hypothetical protein [Planctomycetaceae bacterium]
VFGIPVNCKKEPIKIHRTEYSQTRIKLPPFTLGRVVGDPDDPWGGPVLPKSGISHYMTLFTGDHSPKSYMEAAILMHELSDFAANWHGVYWDDVKLLGQKKFLEICKKAKEEKMDYDFLIGSQQMFSPKTNPTVIVKPDKVIFRFLAYCPLRPERIYFARHIFAEDSMELQYDQDVIAYGQGGIVH